MNKKSTEKKESFFNTKSFEKNVSRQIGVLIIVMLLIFSVILVSMNGNQTTRITSDSLSFIAEENAEKTDLKYSRCNDFAKPMVEAVNFMNKMPVSNKDATFKCQATGEPISESRYVTEAKLLTSIYSLVSGDDNVKGAGICLEPGVFFKDKSYGTYLSEGDLKDVQTFNYLPYTEYGKKDWYVNAKGGDIFVSDLYKDQISGEYVFSISFPIIDDTGFKGVVIFDLKPSYWKLDL